MIQCPKCSFQFVSNRKRVVRCNFCNKDLWKKYPRINIIEITSNRNNGSRILFNICIDCFEKIKEEFGNVTKHKGN